MKLSNGHLAESQIGPSARLYMIRHDASDAMPLVRPPQPRGHLTGGICGSRPIVYLRASSHRGRHLYTGFIAHNVLRFKCTPNAYSERYKFCKCKRPLQRWRPIISIFFSIFYNNITHQNIIMIYDLIVIKHHIEPMMILKRMSKYLPSESLYNW